MAEAKIRLAQAEARVANGEPAFPTAEVATHLGPLLDEWAGGLDNRSAADDRSRISRYIRPAQRGRCRLGMGTEVLPMIRP
jgi:hypothetical protein